MKIKINRLLINSCIALGITAALLPILQIYEGDLEGYRLAFESSRDQGLLETYEIYKHTVGGYEPLSAILSWASKIIGINSHDLYTFFLNYFLYFVFLNYLSEHNLKLYQKVILLSGLYIFVLAIPAERLKIAFIFLVAGVSTKNNYKYIYYICSFLSHFTILFFLAVFSLTHILGGAPKFWKVLCGRLSVKNSFIALVLGALILVTIISIFFKDPILGKLNYYKNNADFSPWVLMNLVPATYFLIRYKYLRREFAALSIVSGVLSVLLGSGRINMLYYMYTLNLLIRNKSSTDPILIIIQFYLIIKSLIFLDNVFSHGTGYE